MLSVIRDGVFTYEYLDKNLLYNTLLWPIA